MSNHDRSRRRKDRLIQTRVPSTLESALKEQAQRRRLSVSHLIRNVLEDTFHLVDNVVGEVDNIVHDSVDLASQLRRDAQQVAAAARGEQRPADSGARPAPAPVQPVAAPAPATTVNVADVAPPAAAADPLAHVYAWNPVVLNRPEKCSKCSTSMEKGRDALVGLSDDPTRPRAWLCKACADAL